MKQVVVMPGDFGAEFDMGHLVPKKITVRRNVTFGRGAPLEMGNEGQYYIDESTGNIWGPYEGNWPATPNYYGNQGYVSLCIQDDVILDTTHLNTFCEVVRETNRSALITLPDPTENYGCTFTLWNNSKWCQSLALPILQGGKKSNFVGPSSFIESSTDFFTLLADDLIALVSDGKDWIIKNYVTKQKPPIVPTATTSESGVGREAIIREVVHGKTEDTSKGPAFATPESIAALLRSLPIAIAGIGLPNNAIGMAGWYYTDISTCLTYGPKVDGKWPEQGVGPVQITGMFE